MEIEKGLTLSQFVDYIESKTETEYSGIDFVDVMNYNDFLKQPLKKEMFVNPFTHPDCMPVVWSQKDGNELYKKHFNQWKEAENKVIFEGYYIKHNDNCIELKNTNDISIYYYPRSKEVLIKDGEKAGFYITEDMLLLDLFQATSGELELKNVTI